MKESYDAILVHGYTDADGYSGDFDDRNYIQSVTVPALIKAGLAENIVLAGGYYWGKKKPPFAEVMAESLVSNGVEPERIILRPETLTTSSEIDVFLSEAEERGWKNLASQSNRTHTPRVTLDYFKKGRNDVDQIKSERVLFNIKDDKGNYPFRDFVRDFRKREKKFKIREAYAISFDLAGLQPLGQKFSESKAGQLFKSVFDG